MTRPISRRACLGALAGAALAAHPRAARAQPRAAGPLATVAILPLGAFPPALVALIDAGLRGELGVATVAQPAEALPAAAWYPARRRYRADRLLDFLRPRLAAPATRILGVTTVDISTSAHGRADWGILGLGDLAGTACVISTFRCRRGARDQAHVDWRMVTTCVHEIGHTLGLEHCPDAACLMADARGSVFTVDHTTGHLCARCRARLGLPPRT